MKRQKHGFEPRYLFLKCEKGVGIDVSCGGKDNKKHKKVKMSGRTSWVNIRVRVRKHIDRFHSCRPGKT